MPLARNLGTLTSWNPLGLSRPVMGLLYLCIALFPTRCLYIFVSFTIFMSFRSSFILSFSVSYFLKRAVLLKNKKPTRCHLLFYCTSYRLNMFRALIRLCLSLQPGHYSSLTAPNLQHTANQERYDQCGNQHHSRELLMMGIVVPETR